jgi:hypothetical protein
MVIRIHGGIVGDHGLICAAVQPGSFVVSSGVQILEEVDDCVERRLVVREGGWWLGGGSGACRDQEHNDDKAEKEASHGALLGQATAI